MASNVWVQVPLLSFVLKYYKLLLLITMKYNIFPLLIWIENISNYFIEASSFIKDKILLILLVFILIAMIGLFFVRTDNKVRNLSIWFANVILLISSLLYVNFDTYTFEFQYIYTFPWSPFLNVYYTLAVDGVSLFFIILSTFLTVVCILVSWESIQYRVREFMILLFLIEFLLINVFTVLDLFLFYVFFEGILIPMFIMIGIWGSRERKIHAAYQFFLYTLTGSILMLLVIIYIYINIGTTYWGMLVNYTFIFEKEAIFWLAIFISLAVKIPMVPVHIWLPEAHVEAPTAGSVLLAGILLKMGGYGFLRFLLPVFPTASHYFTPFVLVIAVISIIYSSLTTIRQIDLKKIIAYSSVGHMNFVMLGIFSGTVEGVEGAIFLMISHGIVSSGLFMCVGILYDRYKTRIIEYYGGLATKMPIFAIFFFIFTLANVGMPGTSSFIGEILILIGIMHINTTAAVLGFTGMIFGAVYSIWLYNRVMFGSVKQEYIWFYNDLAWEISPQQGIDREAFMLFPLVFLILVLGIYPNLILDSVHCASYRIIELQSLIV